MPKIQMLETAKGSPDGVAVNLYIADEIYTVSKELADNFIKQQGIAIPYKAKKQRGKKVSTKK